MRNHHPRIPRRSRFSGVPLHVAAALTLGTSFLLGNPGAVRAAEETTVSAEANPDARSYRLFYDKLNTDGDWLETEQYGYVFQPKVVVENRDWRPYTDGYWAQTGQGWTWISNEPFGWATYHYGRWANLVDVGWVWVPGSEWAPSYVSWRVSKDRKHIGWAPLPPEARLSKGVAIERWVDTAYDIGPEAYVFIDTNNFGQDSYRTHLLPRERNTTIITETENVTSVTYRTVDNRQVVYGGGPDVTVIREFSGRPVREFQLETRAEPVTYFEQQDYRGYNSVNGNRLAIAIAAPDVITSSSIRVSQPAQVRQRLTSVTVDRGYRGVGDPQAVERMRASLRSQGPPPPPEVQREASAAIQRNGAAVPLPGNAAGARGAVTPAPAGASPSPAATAAAASAASPAATTSPTASASPAASASASPPAAPRQSPTARPSASASPSASPAAGASPSASPTARPSASPTASPSAAETPHANTRQEERRAARPTPSASPAEKPSASPAKHESTPAPTATPQAKTTTPAAERETSSPTATPRHQQHPDATPTERPKADAPPRPPAEDRPRGGQAGESAARPREQQPATGSGAAEKSPGAGAERRRETPPAGGQERSEKKAAPDAAGEKPKASPTP